MRQTSTCPVPPADTAPPARGITASRLWSPARRDAVFRWMTWSFATAVLLISLLIALALYTHSLPSIRHFGIRFVWTQVWDPVHRIFGALPFIYGTIVSSAVALAIAVPLSLGTAIFLAELAPVWVRSALSFVVELLAAIPSIVFGLWGIFILVPHVRDLEAWLGMHFGSFPLFAGAPYGVGMLAGGIILAIMVIPILTAIFREVFCSVPNSIREASLALGATRWETIRGPVLQFGRVGILGAVLLGLGRALGETMAITMVIGNRPDISVSLFAPSYTMSSVLANEFTEATGHVYLSALIEIGLLLFVITIIVNAIARWMLWRVASAAGDTARE